MNKSIHESKEICNRLIENNLMNAISEYALGYIVSILITAFSCVYRGKTVDMARNSDRHRTRHPQETSCKIRQTGAPRCY